jgi:hypothetical protein
MEMIEPAVLLPFVFGTLVQVVSFRRTMLLLPILSRDLLCELVPSSAADEILGIGSLGLVQYCLSNQWHQPFKLFDSAADLHSVQFSFIQR